ncbi:MAG: serine/threonine protein kinase [Deltaproteobacteria bacterium]|nr:serine/threonine protein kinase [Deltaproteobacteria bacterium]
MTQLDPPVPLGEVVGDDYRLDEVIGHGGMGVVVRATHGPLALTVAIKFMRRDVCGDDGQLGRFEREAHMLARLATEHVPQVVELAHLPDGEPFLVMELLEGQDLGQRLSLGPVDLEQTLDIVTKACEGLAEAHRQGIIHRDLKPENLFLARELGRVVVKVLDFGCSKQSRTLSQPPRRGRRAVTEPGIGLGTAAYMAPEQWRNARDVDARADLWSLGVILYELLADRHPFPADCVGELMLKMGLGDLVPLEELRPDLPGALTEIVHRCLAVDPRDRPADVEEVLSTLRAVRLGAAVRPAVAPRDEAAHGRGRPSWPSCQPTELAAETWQPGFWRTAPSSAACILA